MHDAPKCSNHLTKIFQMVVFKIEALKKLRVAQATHFELPDKLQPGDLPNMNVLHLK